MTKRVAVTGSSGLIGGALRRALAERGDEVIRLVRHSPAAPDEVQWDPARGRLDEAALDGVDAVVNLAGVGIGDRRWNAEHKREVERSRTDATGTVAQALVAHRDRTGEAIRLVNASAVGYYGDRGEEHLTETSDAGPGLPLRRRRALGGRGPARRRRRAPRRVRPHGTRHGARGRRLRAGRAARPARPRRSDGLGPRVVAVDHPRRRGACDPAPPRPPRARRTVQPRSPGAARQREIASAIGSALSRPAFVPAPHFAMRAVIGEFADYVVASQRVEPAALLASGFTFEHPDLDGAVRWLVRR